MADLEDSTILLYDTEKCKNIYYFSNESQTMSVRNSIKLRIVLTRPK